MLAEGKYKAKPVSGKFGEAKNENKTPCVVVNFRVTDEKTVHEVAWTGWLSENALERTTEALAVMGYRDDIQVDKEGALTESHFDGTEVSVTVKHESYEKDGKTRTVAKVAFVNRLGGGNHGLANTEVTKVQNLLKKELVVARQKLGIKKPTGVIDKTPSFDDTEKLPF